ncbi:MAG: ribbon-helix-helix protein, CopG family [Phycicoccus sp.]
MTNKKHAAKPAIAFDADTDAELMAWAESDAPTIAAGAVIERGSPQSREEVRAMLEAAASTPEELAAVRRSAGGRPTLDPDAPEGESPLWQVRAPKTLDRDLRALAKAEGLSFSEVVRAAATEYLTTHYRAS